MMACVAWFVWGMAAGVLLNIVMAGLPSRDDED